MQHQRQPSQQALAVQQGELQRLQERYARFCQENAPQANPPHCKMRTDAGFATGENLTELIELGYEVETKSGNPAVLTALRSRVTPETVWTPVGKNAEMVVWTSRFAQIQGGMRETRESRVETDELRPSKARMRCGRAESGVR